MALLYVVSAPAGCGKDTILAEVFKKTDTVRYAVSATTRAPRQGEEDGVHYHFLTKEDFSMLIDSNEVLEYTEYCGNYYGTLKRSVDEILEQGKDAVLKIEVEGALNIKKMFPGACLIFVLPPSWEELERRLRERGTETEEVVVSRIKQAKLEFEFANRYDYLVVNDRLQDAVDDMIAIFRAEKCKKERCSDLLESFN